MKRKHISFVVLAFVLVAMMLFSACGGAAQKTGEPASSNAAAASSAAPAQSSAAPAENIDPLGKYDPGITISTIRGIEPSRTFMPGETWDNNIWTKAFEEKLGIKFDYIWTCPSSEFEQKVNVAIASDELPELMCIKYDQFYRLAAAGKLADITSAFDKYAGKSVKKCMTEIANGDGLKMDTFEGKLYGIGNPPGYNLGGHMLWFRDDWLANVGATAPKTWDDVINLMYSFAKKDPNKNGKPTYGLGISKSLWDAGTGLEGFFAAYGAYPTIWVKNGDKLEYGAIQPAAKDALAKLQQLYKDGVIDKEFSIKGDWDNYPDDMIKDKVGLEFGPVWVGDWTPGDIMVNHPKTATWTCMEIPAVNGGIAKRPVNGKQDKVTCMRADTKHPEAMIKLLNLGKALMTDEGTAEGKYHDQKDPSGQTVNNFFHIADFIGGADNVDWNYECAVKVTEALAAKDPSKLNDEQKSYYQRAMDYLDGKDMKGYRSLKEFGPDGAQTIWYKSAQAGNTMPNAFYGPNTDTMNAKLGNLEQKRNEIFTKIIMGSSLDEFDKWVQYFNDQGGADITKEVNDWYAQTQK